MERKSPSVSAFMRNLRRPMPAALKAREFARNMLARLRGKGCCGHPGEPGC